MRNRAEFRDKKKVAWLEMFDGRVQFYFTSTSASWLNQIEIVFRLPQRKTLNGAGFKTEAQLRDVIEAFIRNHDEHSKHFDGASGRRGAASSELPNTLRN